MTPRPGAAPTADRAWRAAAGAAAAVTLAAWGLVPLGSFQYDDHDSVVTSPAAPTLGAFAGAWRAGFRPLLRDSYLADKWLWGGRAAGFLATNLVIHLSCVLAVLALARRRGLTVQGATAAALAFALQPAQSEAVAYYVSGRSSSLMTLFLLLGLIAHDRAAEAESPTRRWRGSFLAWAAFAAAVASKEVALVFPLLVVLWEVTRAGRRLAKVRALLLAHATLAAGLAALALGSARLRSLLEFSFAAARPLDSVAANLAAVPGLLALWVRPGALAIEHPSPAPTRAAVALGAALVALLVLAALALARRLPLAALALLWPLVSLLPTNSLVWKLDPISERSLYLAWVGPALAIGGAAEAIRLRTLRRPELRAAWAAAAVAALLASGHLVRQRVEVWGDSRSLWREATARAPASVRAWNNLGMACWEHDELQAARAAFRRALELAPGDALARQNLFALALASAPDAESIEGGPR